MVLTAAGTSFYLNRTNVRIWTREKHSAATSAMRQLRSGPGAQDCFDDAIEHEPVQC